MANWWDSAPFEDSSGSSDQWWSAAPLANEQRTFRDDADEQLYREFLTAEKQRRAGPQVPVGPDGQPKLSAEETAQRYVRNKRTDETLSAAHDASRTVGRRVIDTLAFARSVPVRMLTRGAYGEVDIMRGLGFKSLGDALAEHEASFVRANQGGLEVAKAIGDVAAGVPVLSTMGAPIKGIAAAGEMATARPSAGAITKGAVRNERLADVEAFRDSGVKPFGPALTEAGTAGVVKQLSDAPIVGAPVRKALGEAIEETRDAGERIAGQYGDARSYRDAGNVIEQGLERFKDAKAKDLGEDAARAMTDEQLASATARPARETSIKTKQDALYERAWRGLPEEMREGKSKRDTTRFMSGLTNTRQTLNDITDRNMSMVRQTRMENGKRIQLPPEERRIAYPLRGGLAGQMVQDIIETTSTRSLQDTRNIRSSFRRLASGMTDTEKNTLQLSDMQRLNSAFTRDMIDLLQRNADHYTSVGDAATSGKITRAIHDFRRADQFTRASAGRLETIEKLYGAQSAEQLGMNVAKDAMGGRKGGNYKRLLALKRSLRGDEFGDVTAGVMRELGRPVASARGAAEEAGFSVQSFITRWNEMSPEGKSALFDRDGLRPALDKFVRVADRMANFEAMANTSRSATNALGMTGLISLISAVPPALAGNLGPAAAIATPAAGMYAFGKFMTSPTYVRWLTRAVELSGDPGRLKVHAKELARLAAKETDAETQGLLLGVARAIGQEAQAPEKSRQPAMQP